MWGQSVADVFLLYVSDDKEKGAAIRQSLVQEGLAVWQFIADGDEQASPAELRRQADLATYVCVLWSEQSFKNFTVVTLATEALRDKKLYSVLLDHVEIRKAFYSKENVVMNISDWTPGAVTDTFRAFLEDIEKRIHPDDEKGGGSDGWASRARRALAWTIIGVVVLSLVAALIAYGPSIARLFPSSGPSTVGTAPTSSNTGRGSSRTGSSQPARNDGLIQDCDHCPELVAVPSGSFKMGDPDAFWRANSMPVRDVRIQNGFAVGIYEVTFNQWQACVDAGSCPPAEAGYGVSSMTDERWRDHPVTGVSWHQATDYVRWLRVTTRKSYRLLTEAEWEYVARAGSKTSYHFGNEDAKLCDYGNGRDLSVLYEGDRNVKCYDHFAQRTAPAGTFLPNKFGVYDMHGNVWEWVEDCYHPNYERAPKTGRAWVSGDCRERVIRGGSWNSKPAELRSAYRQRREAHLQERTIGFRVARWLD